MADHVRVGEVDDDDVEGGVVDGFDDGVGDACGGHLGGEVVGGDLLRWDQCAVFAWEWLFYSAVEEVGDVGVLLGLGDAEVAEVGLRHEVGEEVVHRFGGDDDGEFEVFVVLGHADVVKVGGDGGQGYLGVEFGGFGEMEALAADGIVGETGAAGEDAGDLANAVGAVVEVDDYVVVADEGYGVAFGVDAGEGRDEFVSGAVAVEFLDAVEGRLIRSAFGMAGDHGVESLLLLLPAEIAVHGVVAATDAGELADVVFLKFRVKLFEEAEAAGGQRVAAVHEGVDEDVGEFVLRGEAQECVEVAAVGVDAAIGDEADEMKGSAFLGGELAGAGERGVGEEAAVEDGGVDAGHVHADDPTGAEVQVADFAVAHLAVGQADEAVAGLEKRIREAVEKAVVDGFAGLSNGVAVRDGAVAPTVENGENDGFGHAWSGYQGSTAPTCGG